MRKKLLSKVMLLLMILFVGAGNVWADSYTITFATGTGDGTSANTSTACSTIVSAGSSYLSGNLVTTTNVYYSGSSGLKLGTSKAAGKIKMNLSQSVTPTSIVVNAKLYNSKNSATLKVNGSSTKNVAADGSDLTYNITSEISYIELESSKYCWISSITVNYSSSTIPVITASNVNIAADITSGEIEYTITNPVQGSSVIATTTADWISNFDYSTANKVTFTATENTGAERTAIVTLTYGTGNDAVTKDVTITQAVAVAKYTVTIETPDNGTLVVKRGDVAISSGEEIPTGTELTIEATPAEGYKFRNWQAVDASTHTYTTTFTYTIGDNNVTIRANFDAKVCYAVNWSVNGAVTTESNTYEEGDAIVFPANPSDIEGKTFVGWSETTISGMTNTAPTFVSSATMGTEARTFYAVFADVEESITTQTKSYGFEEGDDASVWTITDAITSDGTYKNSGSKSGKINTSNTYVEFKNKVKVKEFSFAFTRQSGNNNYYVYIETLTDNNSEWSAVETYDMSSFNSDGTFQKKTHTFDGETALYVRFHCYNTTAIRYVDDVTIKYDEENIEYSDYCTTVSSLKKPVITVDETFEGSTTATITCETEGATIKYSYDNDSWTTYSSALTITATTTIYAKSEKDGEQSSVVSKTTTKVLPTPTVTINGSLNLDLYDGTDAGTLSATVANKGVDIEGATVTWSSDDDDVATVNETTGAVTLVAVGTTTITATYAGESNEYNPATATYEIEVVNTTGTTFEKAYTVAQARAAIDANEGITGVYAMGIVSEIVTEYSSQYHNISYNISTDGTTTSDQLQAYRGKSFSGANFTSEKDIQVGDKVVIYGNLKKYVKNNEATYEFDQDNQLVSLTLATPITINAACTDGNGDYYGTFYTDRAYVMDDMLEGYIVDVDANGKLVVDKAYEGGDVVPANTPLLIYALADGDYEVAYTTETGTDWSDDNGLKGTLTASDETEGDDCLFYRLSVHNGDVGFYWGAANGGKFTPGANKAYLAVPTSVANLVKSFSLTDLTDAISEVTTEKQQTSEAYNLMGQRVQRTQKGIVIVNGKKYFNK